MFATPIVGMVHATPPTPILFGVPFDTFGVTAVEYRQAGKNWISYANTYGDLIGDIEGNMTADAHWIHHDWVGPYEDPLMEELEWSSGLVLLTIDPDTVMGETVTGTLTLKFTSPGDTWVIYGGTGDLKGLHGQGTWGMGIVDGRFCQVFEGKIHFDP